MRKTFALIFAVNTSLSFSFIKMKGPFCVEQKNIWTKATVCCLKNHTLLYDMNGSPQYRSVFFYDDQNGYMIASLTYGQILPINNEVEEYNSILEFFRKNKIVNNIKNSKILFAKENLKLNVFDIEWDKTKINRFCYEHLNVASKNSNIHTNPLPEEIKNIAIKNDVQLFQLEQAINLLEITIQNNNEQVTISKDQGKPKNFQKILRKYYGNSKYNNFIKENLIKPKMYNKSGSLIEREIGTYGVYGLKNAAEKLDKNMDSYTLLKKSTILRVDAVLKGDKGENSIICGLAKDNDTNENFYWITDLQQDISTLLN